jgi:hypothetical protein
MTPSGRAETDIGIRGGELAAQQIGDCVKFADCL